MIRRDPAPPAAKTSSQQQKKDKQPDVPPIIQNPERGLQYEKGRFLGKGGFAHCYQLRNMTTNEEVAGKVVPKTMLVKQYQRDKMAQEVHIHKALNHIHIVKLYSFFEDRANVYITLELCNRRSLMELHKRRKAVTEVEARYFTYQVTDGVDYLHKLKIIHRDLKLGNLFLNDEMQVKIGDFGLATTVESDERKNTLCGTPNYIAPEVLTKVGHSFEVDIWAIGCILYTLLFGHPPFESKTLESTYARIRSNQYTIPAGASPHAARLIKVLLSANPSNRPPAKAVLKDPFFKSGYMPQRLPVSCLTMIPKFNSHDVSMEGGSGVPMSPRNDRGPLSERHPQNFNHGAGQMHAGEVSVRVPDDAYVSELNQQIGDLLNKRLEIVDEEEYRGDEYQSPEALPIFWISKWVDYSDKYGIGYQLCDNSVGVLFNDSSRIMLDEAGHELTYVEKSNRETYYNLERDGSPPELNKKMTLLKYFRAYMQDHLVKAGDSVQRKDGDDLARLPALRVWFRTKSAIVLHLSNGTVQINFFADHAKMIMCPLMQAVTFIEEKKVVTYKFSNIANNGISDKHLGRLKYAKTMLERLTSTNSKNAQHLHQPASSRASKNYV